MIRKSIAWILTVAMLVSLFPTTMLAASDSTHDKTATATQEIFVNAEGSDEQGDGSQEKPYATLAKAVEEAPADGATIYVMSDLEMTESVRFWNKHITITSGEGGPYIVSRGDTMTSVQDLARSTYNPAMIEANGNAGEKCASLTLKNIVLDDCGKKVGDYFVQAASSSGGQTNIGGASVSNTEIVQDAMIATYNGVADIILDEGAVLRNYGGMSAVRVSGGTLTMKAGSVIEDTTVTEREKGKQGSFGPAGTIWLQGGDVTVEAGATIQNIIGRAIYADGGQATVGGTINGVKGDADMWQGASGVVIHIRGGASANLAAGGTVTGISAPSTDNAAIHTINSDFEAQAGSVISQITDMMVVYSHDQGGNYSHKMLLNGAISDCTTSWSLMRSFYGNITLGPSGVIENCKALGPGGLLYTHNGSQYTIYGKIQNNTTANVMYLGNWGGGTTYATLEDGGLIANNTGNGVQINGASSGAYFVMNGGEISGNSNGVYMREKVNNHFIMNGGKIINNRLAGISHFFGNRTYIELKGGEISGNGSSYEISASRGAANDSKNYLSLQSGILKGSRTINLAFGRITLDEDYASVSLGKATTETANKIMDDVVKQKGEKWQNQGGSALWFKPTTESFHFTMPRPKVDNILYAGYMPLNADGTPDMNAQMKLIQLEGNASTGSVELNETLDVRLDGLTPNQAYALMLVCSPNVIVSPMDLSKYVTGDDKHEGDDYVNCFPDPRYEGIPDDAIITVSGQKWETDAHGGAEYPFIINYYEEDGSLIVDDHEAGTYTAKVEVLPGLGERPSDILINGQKAYFGTGTLFIRDVANATDIENVEELSSDVTEVAPTESVEKALAVMPKGTQYLVNGISGQQPNPGADIQLLQDEMLYDGGENEDQYMKMMRNKLETEFPDLATRAVSMPRHYTMKYLDLIDVNDSNIIVTPNLPYGMKYDLYVPYPSGTNKTDTFRLFCFEDLNRTYTEKDYGVNVEQVINNSEVSELAVENTDYGIKVSIGRTGRLGAMALTWKQSAYTINAKAGVGGSITPSGDVYVRNTGSQDFVITPDSGYHIEDVLVDGKSVGAKAKYTFENVTENHAISVTFAADDTGNGGGTTTTQYIIEATAGDGGTISPSGRVKVARGSDQSFSIQANAGYEIADVLVDGKGVGAVDAYTFDNVGQKHTIEAVFTKQGDLPNEDETGVSQWLDTKNHGAYLYGYPDGHFGSDNTMSRAEVAQMFYNLLLDKSVPITVTFKDVKEDAWYAEAVYTLASLGMIQGVGNETFEPTRAITRAEFSAMALRFASLEVKGEGSFTDVAPTDWFYDAVLSAAQYGWVVGFEDGTFRPQKTITRAEVTAMVNRMLGRNGDREYIDRHFDTLKKFPDALKSHWAFYTIMEATNSHTYHKEDGKESWLALKAE